MEVRVIRKFRRGRVSGLTVGEVLDLPVQIAKELIELNFAEPAGGSTPSSGDLENAMDNESAPSGE